MPQTAGPQNWLFISDVDDTLLGDEQALERLAAALEAERPGVTLAYSSSRPCASLRGSLAEVPGLPRPDYLIGALGTEIEVFSEGRRLDEWSQALRDGWQREPVAALMAGLGLRAHADEFQTEFKASYHVPDYEQYREVLGRLERHGLTAKVIYSGGFNLDIIPVGADKGQVAEFLRRHLGFPISQVVVAGDSGNDRAMFECSFRGILVANADPDMKALTGEHIYHARAAYAAGVLEGLIYWGILDGGNQK